MQRSGTEFKLVIILELVCDLQEGFSVLVYWFVLSMYGDEGDVCELQMYRPLE